MLVGEIMSRPAFSLPITATMNEAHRLLAGAKVSCLPVLGEDEQVVGVVSESDLLRTPLEHDPRAHLRSVAQPPARPRRVEAVMTRNPFTTREHADVADVAVVFAERGWKSIPVTHEGRLVGVVSRSDVVRALYRSDEEIRSEVRRRLAVDGSPAWRVRVRDAEVTVSNLRTAQDARLAESLAATVRGVRRVVVAPPKQTTTTTDPGA